MKKYVYLIYTFTLIIFTTQLAYAQPIADFEADKLSGCRPLVVSFSDLSTGALSWSWDFGSGTSSVKNPSAFFSIPGTYDIRLIVTDAAGRTDTIIKKDYISVYEFPEADFGQIETEICAGETIQFTDLSTPNSGQLTTWTWDFGNGLTSTDQNPIVSYQAAGLYPVSLLVSNEFGCTDNVVRPGLIRVNAPDVSFEGDDLLACGTPHTVNFTSLGDTLGDHQWFFGDGDSSMDIHPRHTFTSDGSFSITHILTDLDGCTDTLTRTNYIGIGVNTLTASVLDSSICVNDSAYFYSNIPSNSNILWDFGNGQTATTANPAVRYTSPGTYMVTAEASDASGCTYNFEVEVEVSAYPNVNFQVADTTLGCAVPFEVDFINNTSGAVDYFWTFGDGTSSTLENPSHTYTSIDSFTVVLVATGPTGCVAQIHPKDYIKIREIEAGFFAEPQQGCAPLEVIFQDTTHSPYPITNWEWDYGNGTTGTGFSSTVTYPNTGEFPVSLIVTNTKGCKDTLSIDEYIKAGTFPNMDFEIETDSTCALTEIQFTNLTQGAQDYIWFFGDGDTAMSEHPEHGFLALGDLDITLIASDRGCADTLTKTAFVHVKAPLPVIGKNAGRLCYLPNSVALYDLSEEADYSFWTFPDGSTSPDPVTSWTFYNDGQQNFFLTAGNDSTGCVVAAEDSVVANDIKSRFGVDVSDGCVPFTVNFSDSSINAVEWKWYFGNGDSSNLQNPSYTYDTPGSYTVSLVVRNGFFCLDTLLVQNIRALGPDADFQITSASNGCVPFTIDIQDQSQGTSAIVDWEWDFGDGQISSNQHPSHTYINPDLFSIGLTVTDTDGCRDSVIKSDVAFITQPIPNFAVNPPTNCLDANSTFISLSSGSGLFYTWDFGDGNGSHLANTFHSYADTGFYDISLHVVDVNGCDSSITKASFVEIRELEANFWADTLAAPCPPLTVNFKADNSFPHIGVKWKWDFGDGATSTEVFPTHIYNTPG
ncbi:MAG: PKD domain-containing protein, partial [Bacteroidota bacterium]